MPAGFLFWMIWVVALIFGGLGYSGVWIHGFIGFGLVVMILLGLLGWKVFGAVVQ